MRKKFRAFDLFSGIGGFRLGLDRLFANSNHDLQWIGRCEFDKYAEQVYQNIFDVSNEFFVSDVKSVTGDLTPENKLGAIKLGSINAQLPDFDILTAGFPCQSFSQWGKQKGFSDERGTLFYAIEMILLAKKPKYFILENVRNLLRIDNGKTI